MCLIFDVNLTQSGRAASSGYALTVYSHQLGNLPPGVAPHVQVSVRRRTAIVQTREPGDCRDEPVLHVKREGNNRSGKQRRTQQILPLPVRSSDAAVRNGREKRCGAHEVPAGGARCEFTSRPLQAGSGRNQKSSFNKFCKFLNVRTFFFFFFTAAACRS